MCGIKKLIIWTLFITFQAPFAVAESAVIVTVDAIQSSLDLDEYPVKVKFSAFLLEATEQSFSYSELGNRIVEGPLKRILGLPLKPASKTPTYSELKVIDVEIIGTACVHVAKALIQAPDRAKPPEDAVITFMGEKIESDLFGSVVFTRERSALEVPFGPSSPEIVRLKVFQCIPHLSHFTNSQSNNQSNNQPNNPSNNQPKAQPPRKLSSGDPVLDEILARYPE